MFFVRTKTVENYQFIPGNYKIQYLEQSNYQNDFKKARERFLEMLDYDMALYQQLAGETKQCDCVIDKQKMTYYFRIRNVEISGKIEGFYEEASRLYNGAV